jgi:ferredoxin
VIGPGSFALDLPDLDRLFQALRERGHVVVGPTVRDGAIVLDELERASDLPVGWRDEQEPGRYRLLKGAGPRAFACTLGPQSWKKYLHPARLALQRTGPDGEGVAGGPPPPRYAFVGIRPCELAAIAKLDRVMTGSGVTDAPYAARREGVFLVAVNCTRPGGTCFCASTGTGPRATAGFDIVLTEVVRDDTHVLVAEPGSPRGQEVLTALPARPAAREDVRVAEETVAEAASHMGRTLETTGLPERLRTVYEHPRWEEVARRCLSCANCTLVCPTCFCWTAEDATDLVGASARTRRWDSCFGLEFSFIHGGSVRTSGAARYRHWLLHKLCTWHDQFGASGCVGCGRCITWCPAGIDITEEARAVAAPRSTGGEP